MIVEKGCRFLGEGDRKWRRIHDQWERAPCQQVSLMTLFALFYSVMVLIRTFAFALFFTVDILNTPHGPWMTTFPSSSSLWTFLNTCSWLRMIAFAFSSVPNFLNRHCLIDNYLCFVFLTLSETTCWSMTNAFTLFSLAMTLLKTYVWPMTIAFASVFSADMI